MRNLKNNNKGFTLIELIVVMIIIGILVLLATPRFIRYIKDANATSLQVDAKVIQDAALYQNLRAYNEAGIDRESGFLNPTKFGDLTKAAYKKDADGLFPNTDIDLQEGNFENWKNALIGTVGELTGLSVEVEGSDTTSKAEDALNATTFAALNSEVYRKHIRNTRYGIENFIVATDGPFEGEAFYISIVEDGDNIAHVALIPSNFEVK